MSVEEVELQVVEVGVVEVALALKIGTALWAATAATTNFPAR